jgi:hypothetical protein
MISSPTVSASHGSRHAGPPLLLVATTPQTDEGMTR